MSFLRNLASKLYWLFWGATYKCWPDALWLKITYRAKMKRKLNLKNPQSFSEKLAWLKIHDKKKIYTQMVDKYDAKNFVRDRIGDEVIIPTYGVWNDFDEIDFSKLPNKFVLKCTHDSGGIVICRDKDAFDLKRAKVKLDRSLRHNFWWWYREWPYKNVTPRILAEQYMEDETSKKGLGLTDYKFYFFNV